jgi:clathrin coat assembly protein AP180
LIFFLQAGGLDLLTLDSLYDDANRRASQTASYNPWEAPGGVAPMMQTMAPAMHGPFYASSGFAAPHGVQMAAMAQQQQQQAFMLQQQMMAAPAPVVHHHPMHQQAVANPFGNPYGAGGMPLHAGPGNAYTGLI